MAGELVPELHDIGKLTDIEPPHNFENFDFAAMGISPETPVWKGILEHHLGDETRYPTSANTFMLMLADGLACAVSRLHGEEQIKSEKQYYCLWKGYQDRKFNPIDQKEAATFVERATGASQYFQVYGDLLRQRAEEAKANITSLHTHSLLVGKLYRVMRKAFPIEDAEIVGKSKKELIELRGLKGQNWKLKLLVLQPRFWMSPWRTKDLGVFTLLQESMKESIQQFPDNTLLVTSGELLLVVEDSDKEKEIREVFLKRGFWLNVWEIPMPVSGETKTGKLRDIPDLIESVKQHEIKPYYPGAFPPNDPIPIPICPTCQKAPATVTWVSGDTTEELCPTCYKIRESGQKLHNLEDWSTEKVAWVRIYLDFECLLDSLGDLLKNHLNTLGFTKPEREVRF